MHEPSGSLYVACATTDSQGSNYVARYEPTTSRVTRLSFADFAIKNAGSFDGLDVVTSASDSHQLYVYFVYYQDADSSSTVEIFSVASGGTILHHLHTLRDPTVIFRPSDVSGSSDGKSFYFTNAGSQTPTLTYLDLFQKLWYSSDSVGYCHVDTGCKLVAPGLSSASGIAASPNNDTIYVSNTFDGTICTFESQQDHGLVLSDVIKTGLPIDGITVDHQGHIWATASLKFVTLKDKPAPSRIPSVVVSVTLNTGVEAYYGEKYAIHKVFDDDGALASGATAIAHDASRKRLYLYTASSQLKSLCIVISDAFEAILDGA